MLYFTLRPISIVRDDLPLDLTIYCDHEEFAFMFLEFYKHYHNINSLEIRNLMQLPLKRKRTRRRHDNDIFGIYLDPDLITWMIDRRNIMDPEKYIRKHVRRFLKHVAKRYELEYKDCVYDYRQGGV